MYGGGLEGKFNRQRLRSRRMCGSINIIVEPMNRLMWGICVVIGMLAMGGAAPRYIDHQDLMYWLDEKGKWHAVKTKEDWVKRREHIRSAVQLVMGEMPQR